MIPYTSRLSFKCIILAPLALMLSMVSLLAYNFTQSLGDNVQSEYDRMTEDIAHSVKLLGSLNYSFATYFTHKSELLPSKTAHHKVIGEDGLCLWKQSAESIQSAYRADARKVLQIDYAVKGLPEACDPNSEIYKDISSKLLLAPTFSFLNGIEDYIVGLYYVSPLGYIISSPANLATNVHKDSIPIMKSRKYWIEGKSGHSVLRLTGPVVDVATGKPVLSISAGLFDNDQFEGLVLLDISVSKLVSVDPGLDQRITFQVLGENPLPQNAWMPRTLLIDGVETNQIMYFNLDLKKEVHTFFVQKQTSLFGLVGLYFLTVIFLIYWRVRDEKRHFHSLALHDPMTGLLNRRGFYQGYQLKTVQPFEAIATFDIDDFKKINDTHGHNIGDDVIIFVSKVLTENIRLDDIVARFGGEEFVVYLQSDSKESMIGAIERVHQVIAATSSDFIVGGFTVSGGIAIQDEKRGVGLDRLIKQADEKLYQAKRTGKNKLIY
ncbi:sensor domain-containing diguanylate cyclase [Vibrio rumoiensis]|uniref:diguanylate cyclase n=1 Tax=Vibrio rumoiensis 1S-45 TaxID=1188252 RepID=A0A1E5E3V1_9VIBR|nr:sensor domain-containing diguanylate cyclase [Vibrio rumoiensis]OEF26952.1 hypothetical protein A1QC_00875 [Vibrio rumoiensis 1S-45]